MTRQKLPSLFTDTSPFFQNFQKEMADMMDHFRHRGAELGPGSLVMPAMDVAETEDGLEITAEVPGVNAENLDVSLNGEVLTIKGEKRSDHEETKKDIHLVERSYGSFRRQIPLGFVPDDDAVASDFKNGVLKLTIRRPASGKSGVRKIEID